MGYHRNKEGSLRFLESNDIKTQISQPLRHSKDNAKRKVYNYESLFLKIREAGHWWLRPIILAT
jgi:hypothetical protein